MCYKLHTDLVQWFQAAENCVIDNGTLASFSDGILTDNSFHMNLLNNAGGDAWIGLLKRWWIWPGIELRLRQCAQFDHNVVCATRKYDIIRVIFPDFFF